MSKYKLITILKTGQNKVNKLPDIDNDADATNIFDQALAGIMSLDPHGGIIKSVVMWDGGREVCRWPALEKDLDAVESMAQDAFWNGLPTKAVRGTGIVAESAAPLFWGSDLVGTRIEVVLVNLEGVNYGGGAMLMDNRDGSAWYKVTEGKGSPRLGHRNLLIQEGSFEPHE